ncbi:winged helix-turn-helix transcriptional regulator [Nanchangia anserum]|uniref:Winged helix-turn-helix transcriptional regulator n=1 Tax=Nanchangia anserum TaxID=2692125 RepID=A0A8I0KR09_9ACTO|nr:winged helix-turn-helix transcriptional regulator [Nanchangia anserum]QOX82618.1 winged helix-turn-helix transcriptional regulator [Nanchangia anserum]
MDALARRVEKLESDRIEEPPQVRVGALAQNHDDNIWALEWLKARSQGSGAVMIVGNVVAPEGAAASWQQDADVDDLLESDWSQAAECLSALAHPVRLRILQAVIRGRSTAKELAELDGVGSVGQVYHHLRALTAAGWLTTKAGGAHQIPAPRRVPLLVAILAGEHR